MEQTTSVRRHPAPTRSTTVQSGRPSLGSLFGKLFRETTSLVQEEAELAKAELSEKLLQAASGATMLAVGGAIVYAGFLALLVAATNALILLLPAEYAIWLAPLIVGVVVMLVGFVLLANGRSDLKARNLTPSRTMQSLRRDGELVKEHVQ